MTKFKVTPKDKKDKETAKILEKVMNAEFIRLQEELISDLAKGLDEFFNEDFYGLEEMKKND
ncbi:MAG: hypothetical protein WCJ81_09070 [bacterium]